MPGSSTGADRTWPPTRSRGSSSSRTRCRSPGRARFSGASCRSASTPPTRALLAVLLDAQPASAGVNSEGKFPANDLNVGVAVASAVGISGNQRSVCCLHGISKSAAAGLVSGCLFIEEQDVALEVERIARADRGAEYRLHTQLRLQCANGIREKHVAI